MYRDALCIAQCSGLLDITQRHYGQHCVKRRPHQPWRNVTKCRRHKLSWWRHVRTWGSLNDQQSHLPLIGAARSIRERQRHHGAARRGAGCRGRWEERGSCVTPAKDRRTVEWSLVGLGRQDVDKLTGVARFMTKSVLRSLDTSAHTYIGWDRHTERDRQTATGNTHVVRPTANCRVQRQQRRWMYWSTLT